MKLMTSLLLFVFFSLFVEDALFAHAGAEDLSPCHQENHFSETQHKSSSPSEPPHRNVCHFGHCSFLLVAPIQETQLEFLPKVSLTPYVFSLAICSLEPSKRPPIA
jgi:hypothetical protein